MMLMMITRVVTALLPLAVPAQAWDRGKAMTYLEARQSAWAAWNPAQKTGGACLSCHTGLGYMMARRALGESKARPLEQDLVNGVTARLTTNPRPVMVMTDEGAEAVLNLFALSLQRRGPGDPVSTSERVALDDLAARQIREGAARGTWSWFDNGLDPMDTEVSNYYAAALASAALDAYSTHTETRSAVRAFLERDYPRQPLHNKLAWIGFSNGRSGREKEVLATLWSKQSPDGGWTTASLGPWAPHPDAPPDSGSNAYATAWAAFNAQRAGAGCQEPGLKRALDWLARKQDAETGAWPSPSMNKVYPPDSMPAKFMTDAASGYAVAVLAACGR